MSPTGRLGDKRMQSVIYARLSMRPRGKPDREGDSIDAQLARCRANCAVKGYEPIVAEERDKFASGGRADNRPGLQRAIAAACEHRGVLVVYSLSRLARSIQDAISIAEQLHKDGAQLCSVTENIDTTTPMGRFFFHVMASLGQLEREIISERTGDAMRHYQEAGRAMGSRPPIGKRKEGAMLVNDEREMEIIRVVCHLYTEKKLGPHVIARTLMERGIKPRADAKVWWAQTIKGILRRAGLME